MNKIVLMGECMIELIQSGNSINKQGFAGDVYNTAVYLKRLFPECTTKMLTAVGSDSMSEQMISVFKQENYPIENKQPGIYLVQTDEYGERSFLYWRESAAARQVVKSLTPEVVSSLCENDVFFFSGISLAVITPEDRDDFWEALSTMRAAGVKIAFDLNYRPKLWASEQEAQTQFTLAFESADILVPGVDDFAQLFKIDTVEGVKEYFTRFTFDELIIKNGEKSVICITQDEECEVAITPVKNVVDTTSAGDSFNGAYLGARMTGTTISDAVTLAAEVAGFVIQHPGAIVPEALFNKRFNLN